MTRTLSTLLVLIALGTALAAPGDLDPGFHGTGTVVTPIATGSSQATAIVRQGDGKLVVAGAVLVPVVGNPDNIDFLVVRYDASGALDPTFGGGTGIVTTAIRTGEDTAHAVIQQTDGKLVVAGVSYDEAFNDSMFSLVRYQTDGTLDPTFGGGTGMVTTPIAAGAFDAAWALLQQADGKLVAAGTTDAGIAVVRYDTSGMLDAGFGGTGIVTTVVGGSSIAKAVVEQAADHKLVIAGSSDADIALVRYGTDGTPDAGFNGTGIVTTTVGAGNAEARGLVQQASGGKLVVAGVSNDGTNDQFTLVRYGTNGAVDTAGFGTSGVVTTSVGAGNSSASGLVEQADGKLVAAGVASNGTNTDFALVRYGATGTPDATFGTAGVVTTPIGTGDDAAAAIAYQPDGFLVAAGFATSARMDVAAARYVGIENLSTSTTTTSTTAVGSTTTSTTLGGALVPGGPSTKTSSDCYLELLVAGATAAQVQGNKVLVCNDGDPCDSGPAGDDRCDLRIAGCVNQSDPALSDCTPPGTLASARISGKVAIDVSRLLVGSKCTAPVAAAVPVKRNKRGAYVAGKSKLVLKGLAKALKGVSPRKDADRWTIQCAPASP
jgi:uncharacterized delta-60 repeat protein